MELDVAHVRSHFPALQAKPAPAFFENAGGSFACHQTIAALQRFYTETKVQPYADYAQSAAAGQQMDRSFARWAEALGVAASEVSFGPSTSMNTYVLARAFAELLGPGDEIVVTNQDHEANTGAIRRMAGQVGATLLEWRIDPDTGLLDPAGLARLLTDNTKLVCFPHCSNIIGQENDVRSITDLAHGAGARVICDGVSFAPHGIPDVGSLGPDIYLFSLYKVYSVHQGLMVTQHQVMEELPSQAHYFNADVLRSRLTPAGPDHAQVGAAGAVLDYVESLHAHHGGTGGLAEACRSVSKLWQNHETALLVPVLELLANNTKVRLLGPADTNSGYGHRAPTVAFSPLDSEPAEVVQALIDLGVMTSHGSYYANRVLEGADIVVDRGVVRVSWLHYTSQADIDLLLESLQRVLQ